LDIPVPYFVAGGTLTGNVLSYIERQADTELYNALLAGEYCYVLDTRQVGKSSLMVRAARRLSEAGCCTALVDLSTFGDATTEEQWYFQLLCDLTRVLGMEEEAEAFWDRQVRVSCAQRWFLAVRDLVLPRLQAPLVVFVDELEAVRKLSFSADGLFAMVRALSNLRAQEPCAERLTFCLVGVATPADLIRDPRTTPFNIGRRIELHDFAMDEMALLARGLQGTQRQREEQVRRIGFWTGGHPYLTQRFCQSVAEAGRPLTCREVDALCWKVFLCKRAQSEEANLHFVRRQVLDDPEPTDLLLLYDRLRARKRIEAGTAGALTDRLLLSGLARIDADREVPRLVVRNRIYESVFNRRWVRGNLPGAEVRRQKQALRLGFLRASLLWCVLVGTLLFALARQWQVSQQQGSIAILKGSLKSTDDELKQRSQKVKEAEGRLVKLNADIAGKDSDLKHLEAASRKLEADNRAEHRLLVSAQGAQREAVQSAKAIQEESEAKRESALALMGSVVSGQEFEALEHGLNAVTPALSRHREPSADAMQGLSSAVSAGIYRLLRLQHGFRLETAEFSDDGRWIVTAGSSRDIYVWDARTGMLNRKVTVLPQSVAEPKVWTAEFSWGGRYLVTASSDHRVRVWEAASLITPTPKCVWTIDCGKKTPFPVLARFSKSGNYLAVNGISEDGYGASVYEVATHKKIAFATHDGVIESLDFNGSNQRLGLDERYLALAGKGSQAVSVLDFLSNKVVHTYTQASGDPARRALFNFWDNNLYSAGNTGSVTLWNWADPDGSNTRYEDRPVSYQGHQGPVSCLTASRDGFLIASTGFNDSRVQVWIRAFVAHPLYTLHSHESKVTSVRFSNDCSRLVTASYDCTAEVWALDCRLYGGGSALNYLVLSPDGKRMAAPTEGRVVIWSTEWNPIRDGGYQIWARQHVGELEADHFTGTVFHAAYSPDGKKLATAAAKGDVRIWDVPADGGFIDRYIPLMGHDQKQKVSCVAFSPDSLRLLSASDDATARLWDARTGKEIDTFKHPDKVISCAFSPDGGQVLTACADGATRLYDLGRHLPTLLMQPPGVRGWDSQHYPWSVAFSPDGRYLLTGDADFNAYLWDRASGKLLATLPYQHAQVFSAQFSADGLRVLTVGEGGYAEIWGVPQALEAEQHHRNVLPSLSLHPTTDMLFGGQFSLDGQYIFVAGADCLVRKYPVTVEALVREAHRIRNLGNAPASPAR